MQLDLNTYKARILQSNESTDEVLKSEQQHTPGPWKFIRKARDGKRIIVESHQDGTWERMTCEIDSDDCCSDTAMANARLIASAPELLAACELALGIVEQNFPTAPDHFCGSPNASCDMSCVEFSRYSETIAKLHAAIGDAKRGQ